MATVTRWPESGTLDNDFWKRNDWGIGTPITKEKLENLETGIAILATQMKAILGEFKTSGVDTTGWQLNSSRLDNLQSWITGGSNTSYPSDKTNIAARLNNIEATDASQSNKLAAIISEIGGTGSDGTTTSYGGTSRIDSLATEVWGSNTVSGTSRLDDIETELGGSRSAGNGYTNSKLDDLEKEIGGTRSAGNGYTNSRIDTLESTTSTHTNELTAIKSELGGAISGSTYGGTTRLDSVITEVWSSNTTSGTSRIDKNDNKIAAIANELGGTAPDGTSTTYSGTTRLDDLEKEIGGTRSSGNGYTGSRIDNLQTWLTGSLNGVYSGTAISGRLNTIDNLDSEQNERLENTENDIADIQAWIGNGSYDISQYGDIATRLLNLENELSGANDGVSNSRLDDLEKELCGGPIVRDSINGGYSNTRLDKIQTWITGTNIANYNVSKGYIESRLGALESNSISNRTDIDNVINEIGGSYSSGEGFSNSEISKIAGILTKNEEQDTKLTKIKLEVWGPETDWDDASRIDTLTDNLRTTSGTVNEHNSRIGAIENIIDQQQVAATTFLYRTTNTTPSDILTLDSTAILGANAITLIVLTQGTEGIEDIKIQDPTTSAIKYPIYITDTKMLRALFPAGSILGIYRDSANKIYMFNAPLVL